MGIYTFLRILHKGLSDHPYKIQIVPSLKPTDLPVRLHFAETLLQHRLDSQNLWISDEAHFYSGFGHIYGYFSSNFAHGSLFPSLQNPDYSIIETNRSSRYFAETFLQHGIDSQNWWISDEAHFYFSSYTNEQNSRYRSLEYPQELHQDRLRSPKVALGMQLQSSVGFIGPYFFSITLKML